jgi:glutathione S-transferase
MTLTLYDMQDSPHARKVRLLAAELGLPLAKIERDPRKGETRSSDYLAKNPNGRVPTLDVQSRGVMDWVEPEATRVFCPDLADIFVRCEAA